VEPQWLNDNKGAKPNGLPSATTLQQYGEFVRSSVRAHPFVSVFEIQNEPDLTLMASRNLPLAKGVKFYTDLINTAAPIIREEAPGVPIAGANVSGQDQKAGFPMSQAILNQAGDLFDIWAPHPYASPRHFGSGLSPLSPEENFEKVKHQETLAVIRDLSGQHRYWIGEKGWAIQNEATLFGKIARSFADYMVRSLIIAKSVSNTEKYFWFRISNETREEDHRYALFRGKPLQPMPSAIAYANTAYHLDHAQPIASFERVNGAVQVKVFKRLMTNTTIAALWSVKTPFALNAMFPIGTEAFDPYGRKVSLKKLELTETPLFLQTSAQQDKALLSALQDASFEPSEPFEIVAAYLHDLRTLTIDLRNNTSKVVRVAASANSQTKKVALLPNLEEPTRCDIVLSKAVTAKNSNSLPYVLTPREGKPITGAISTDLSTVRYRPGITVDAKTDDWANTPAIALQDRNNVLPPDEAGWKGPEDLSMRVSLAWDETNLYLLVRVTDDVHYTTGSGQFWNKDSLQIALDVLNNADSVSAFDADDREYGLFVDDGNNAQAFQTYPLHTDTSVQFPVAGVRVGKETVYEMAFPWSQLGREPMPGTVFSLNVTANDNDGTGKNYWMGITAGIVEGKQPQRYQDFYLAQ
jgi:hypothetical protein